MNLRQLKYFVGIVDAGNMTRAAERLNVAQTALGMQVRQLEEDLGVALLVRHSRGVDPTPAGKLLYARACDILKLADETRRDVAAVDKESCESIRFGITPALMLVAGTELALIVRETLPNVFLSIVEAMSHVLAESLAKGVVDFILCYDVPDMPNVTRIALLRDDLVLVTEPRGCNGKPVAFVDILDETLAMPETGDTVRTVAARTARELGTDLKVTYEVRSVSAMKSLVARGAAASILPYFAVLKEVGAGTLDARPIVMPALRRTFFLACLKGAGVFRCEAGLTAAVRRSLHGLLDDLGPLAEPLWMRAP